MRSSLVIVSQIRCSTSLLSSGYCSLPPMSEEQLKAFLEKVQADTNIQEKLKAAASPEAAIEIAKEAGFSITAEDIQSMQSAPGEVSDAELEGAAGGGYRSAIGDGLDLHMVRGALRHRRVTASNINNLLHIEFDGDRI